MGWNVDDYPSNPEKEFVGYERELLSFSDWLSEQDLEDIMDDIISADIEAAHRSLMRTFIESGRKSVFPKSDETDLFVAILQNGLGKIYNKRYEEYLNE